MDKIEIYDKMISSVNESEQSLDARSLKLVDELIEDIDKNEDPCSQAACMQLIADLARSTNGLNVLEAKNVPQKLISHLNGSAGSDPLVLPHALKFFYRINAIHIDSKYPQLLETLFDYFKSDDVKLIDYAVDFIAAVGHEGYYSRKVLDKHQRFREDCLAKMGSILKCSDSLLKTRTLNCIKELIYIKDEDPAEESTQLSDSFYHAIIPGEMKMTKQLLNLCSVPFREISQKALDVVLAVADQEWAKGEIESNPELNKFIQHKTTDMRFIDCQEKDD